MMVTIGATLAGAPGCGSCSRHDDNRLEVYVDALIAESGTLSDDARAALVAHGRSSIVILETGLYRAEADGRRRIARTLTDIGHPDVVAILAHLAEHDPDESVREVAARGIARLDASLEQEPTP